MQAVKPCLALALVQCSGGWSGVWFLIYAKQATVVVHPDSSHGNHDDIHNAIKRTGSLWHVVLRTSLGNRADQAFRAPATKLTKLLEHKQQS
eukprot:4623113-Amphidinium_carterae.1